MVPHIRRRCGLNCTLFERTTEWKFLVSALCILASAGSAFAIGQARYVETAPSPGSFAIAQGKAAATLCVDSTDWPGVVRAVGDLQADIERVTGVKPAICSDAAALKTSAIIIGTVGRAPSSTA